MNILTFDIEEWYIKKGSNHGIAALYYEFDGYLNSILELLSLQHKKATFFCLGKMAMEFPDVVRRIAAGGHEIGCHSDKHGWLTQMTLAEAREDTRCAIDALEQCVGQKVLSYRAPAFSIGLANAWAFEILAECGIERDASVFPAVRDFGGFANFGSQKPCKIKSHGMELKEFPIPMVTLFGKKVAYSGGGYFRFFPLPFVRYEMQQTDYAMTYFHIGDLLPEKNGMMSREAYERYFKENGSLLNRGKRYVKSNLGKKNANRKLMQLIEDTDFIDVAQADSEIDWQSAKVIDMQQFRGGGKRILFLTLSHLYDIERHSLYGDLMRQLVHEGNEVYIVAPFERKQGRKTELFMSGGVHVLGVKTLNIQKTNIVEKGIGTVLIGRQFLSALKKHLGDVSFDVVLYTTPPITLNNVVAAVKRKYNAKSYLLLKDIFPQNAVDLGMFSKHSPFYWYFRSKERKLYALSDYIGCMSPANVQFVLKHNPKIDPQRVEVCPNSVDPDLTKPAVDVQAIRRQYGISTDKVLCVYGGNLGKPQGVDFLLETIASNEKRENCYILVVGSGTEFGKVEAWFRQHNPKNAKLQSSLPKEDYDRLIRTADVGLIYLDRRFTIPNYPSRLLSYMENSIPVMMATDTNTDVGQIAEQNGYGLWAESGDVKAFDAKLDTLLVDAAVRTAMGQKGYEYLLQHYTVKQSAEIIMSHFK